MPTARHSLVLTALVALLATACTPAGAGSVSTTSEPTQGPDSSGGTTGGIEHPTGARDVVLRYEEGGGFMMMEWALTEAPIFTLYGDGTIVFRDPAAQPPPDEHGLLAFSSFRTARLSEEQVQSLLTFAVNEGALGVAKDRYDHPGVADAGTARFTVNAGGRTKTVEVYALGLDENAPDKAARAQFLALATRLRAFDEAGAIPTDEYVPHGWRAVLIEAQGAPTQIRPWPWAELSVEDFMAQSDDPTAPAFPAHVLSADEVGAIGLGDLNGGLLGLSVKGPDDKIYGVPIRPLLPDEER